MKRSDSRTTPGKVRIIGGALRGSRLVVPDAPGLRPTPDRARETVFNWLAPIVVGADCLDLYAGTGAMGIEALSRGAAACTFIERDRAAARLLGDNVARLKLDHAQVVQADVAKFLGGSARPFDLVFLDPPFAANLWKPAAMSLEERGWLRPDAWIHVEMPLAARLEFPVTWQMHREGRAGAMRHVLYRRFSTPC
ncbi:MAG: 16S rRNA (guanine(966)-N(2))-methyltransferase RsmD [Rhodanobacteraceae bacterium]